MKKVILSVCVLFMYCVFFTSCASVYIPADQIIPEHIKNIYIQPVINATDQPDIEVGFTNHITDEFIIDGRLSVVNSPEEADAVIIVTIKKYVSEELTYDKDGEVKHYKLWVAISASLVDKDNNVSLWTEPNLEGVQIYRRRSDEDDMTEEEARQNIWTKVSGNIVRRVVKEFALVTNILSKKVPA